MAKLYFKYGAMGSSKSAQALITQFMHFVNVLTAVSLLHHTRFARIAVIIRA